MLITFTKTANFINHIIPNLNIRHTRNTFIESTINLAISIFIPYDFLTEKIAFTFFLRSDGWPIIAMNYMIGEY